MKSTSHIGSAEGFRPAADRLPGLEKDLNSHTEGLGWGRGEWELIYKAGTCSSLPENGSLSERLHLFLAAPVLTAPVPSLPGQDQTATPSTYHHRASRQVYPYSPGCTCSLPPLGCPFEVQCHLTLVINNYVFHKLLSVCGSGP